MSRYIGKPNQSLHQFWGKFRAEDQMILPLTHHCLDVGMVFWNLCQVQGIRRAMHAAAGQKLSSEQISRLSVLACLHDAGKANLGFQRKVFETGAVQAGHIRELAPILDLEVCDPQLQDAFLKALPTTLHTWFDSEEDAYSYLLATFSHHGRPLRFHGERRGTFWLAQSEWWQTHNNADPFAAIAEISHWTERVFSAAWSSANEPLPSAAYFHHRFAGLVMLADWIGSHPQWFPIQNTAIQERIEANHRNIPVLLENVGIDVSSIRTNQSLAGDSFESRFGFPPRPLQSAIEQLDPSRPETQLIIAESETGSGKTEAALHWFYTLFKAGKIDGLYFALPTRVAARELYERINRTIQQWFPDSRQRPATVLAVPGYTQVDGVPMERSLPHQRAAVQWHDDPVLDRRERQWAAEHPKRFLAASVAVGTIDQALLSTIQTAHAHLRSVCLDRHLLVIDEVHASDLYMSTLLQFLLKHHRTVGGYSMLLSATLGARARHQLTRGNQNDKALPNLDEAVHGSYPAVTLQTGSTIPDLAPSSRQRKHVCFETRPWAQEAEALVDFLVEALFQGARILVVLNTVDRANELLLSLERHRDMQKEWLFSWRGKICPHHGRFAPADRSVLDRHVTASLGQDGSDGPLLLVGTQTLEQSLDIDADLLVTDLAPADVLLQRVGRLHRHHNRRRPASFERARCVVLVPEQSVESGLDLHGYVNPDYLRMGYGSVYPDMRTLHLTHEFIRRRPEVSIPDDNRLLVETATHPESLATLNSERWTRHGQIIEGGELAQTIAASSAAAVFDVPFHEVQFNEAGAQIAARLCVDSLHLPLEEAVISPFEQTLSEIVIPGHMAPNEPDDSVSAKHHGSSQILLSCGGRHYKYSRYGLEVYG